MKNLLYILFLVTLIGCQDIFLSPDYPAEYRGEIVIGEVITTGPTELEAEPLDMERVIPTDSIVVVPSDKYEGLDPATLDTVQVVMRYKEGIRYWLDSATATD